MPRGAVFVPFCYYEAAANLLTNPVLDPFGKNPGIQVLRGEGDARRPRARASELRAAGRFFAGNAKFKMQNANPTCFAAASVIAVATFTPARRATCGLHLNFAF